MTTKDIIASAPYVAMVLGAISLMIFGDRSAKDKDAVSIRAALGSFWCLIALILTFPAIANPGSTFSGLIMFDGFTFVLVLILLLGTMLSLLLTDGTLAAQRLERTADLEALMIFATLGGMVMVSAAELITLFIGLELLSISVYALAGMARTERASAEAALKYFVLGSFSSAFMLYGIALIYGVTGSTELLAIGNALHGQPSVLLLLGFAFLVFGFGFKVSLVPFHFWTPDVYQGSPLSATAYMAVVVKTAAFGAFLRVMLTSFSQLDYYTGPFIWTLAVATMSVGNLLALRQDSVKRMLAYSSIAHAGYLLMGVLVLANQFGGAESIVFYLLTYTLMTIGSFGVVLLLTLGSTRQYSADSIQSLRGKGWTSPFLALCLTISLLSLGGIPPLAGFMGKLYMFKAAITGGYTGLVIIAALNSVISLYYYLRIVVVMYFQEAKANESIVHVQLRFAPVAAIAIVSAGMCYIGIFASQYYGLAEYAIGSVR
ncbi:NADH-quinone oxidoreductase subunit N [bacterium]|nr:NADH-quinone oxidoreductase subunit N [bacterium]